MDHRTERIKLKRCSTAPAVSFRPVSTTIELLMLGKNLLCIQPAFLQSLDCHSNVAFSSEAWLLFPKE